MNLWIIAAFIWIGFCIFMIVRSLMELCGITRVSKVLLTTTKGYRRPPSDSTFGWRAWLWNDEQKCLESPTYHTLWPDGECRAKDWDDTKAVRDHEGVHAMWPIPKDWQNKHCIYAGTGRCIVVGVVERYGHYILGENGWRAEWVVVRELAVHKSLIEEVQKAYPGIPVHERAKDHEEDHNHIGPIVSSGRLIDVWPGQNISVSIGAGGGGGTAGVSSTTASGTGAGIISLGQFPTPWVTAHNNAMSGKLPITAQPGLVPDDLQQFWQDVFSATSYDAMPDPDADAKDDDGKQNSP